MQYIFGNQKAQINEENTDESQRRQIGSGIEEKNHIVNRSGID